MKFLTLVFILTIGSVGFAGNPKDYREIALLEALRASGSSTKIVSITQPANPIIRIGNWGRKSIGKAPEQHIYKVEYTAGSYHHSCYAMVDRTSSCAADVTVGNCDENTSLYPGITPERRLEITVNICNTNQPVATTEPVLGEVVR